MGRTCNSNSSGAEGQVLWKNRGNFFLLCQQTTRQEPAATITSTMMAEELAHVVIPTRGRDMNGAGAGKGSSFMSGSREMGGSSEGHRRASVDGVVRMVIKRYGG